MEKIEHAVGKNGSPFPFAITQQFRKFALLAAEVGFHAVARVDDLLPADGDDAKLLDSQPAGHIGQRGGGTLVCNCCQCRRAVVA